MGRLRTRGRALLAGAAAVLTATGGLALGVGAAPAGASPTTTATAAATFSAPAAKPAPPTSVGARSGYTIADPRFDYNDANGTYGAPFVALTGPSGPISTVYTGVYKEAAYRVEVPQKWNGDLVLFAHGYRGTGNVVFVDSPALRKYFVAHGFAWAASSYADNGYDVAQGVIDTHNLFTVFGNVTGRTPKATYMTGDSMGGHITAVEIEHYKGSFVGAMPYCGVLGGNTLFNYFLDANVTAAALTGTKITYPLTPPPASFAAQYAAKVTTSILPKLGTGFNTASGPTLSPLGQEWETSVEYSTGGLRPGFASAFSYWNSFGFAPLTKIPFLFGLYPGLQGGTVGVAPGNVASNTGAVYRVDANQHLSPADQALNAAVLRVKATTASPPGSLSGIPVVVGDPGIPVLSIHGIGDLFVPFSMDQIYARRMAAHGQAALFVSRAIREVTHCGYSGAELTRGFSDLVNWVTTGHKPAGDNILDPKVVASPTFGCRFTDGSHPLFKGQPCPGRTPRISGVNRVATAVAASKASFGDHGAGVVVLATDTSYPDALAGGPLAAAGNGPLLLTSPGALSQAARDELMRVLAPGGTVVLVGGSSVLSDHVAAEVKALGYQVTRDSGANRFATAVAIAKALGSGAPGGGPAAIFETTGINFPDALAASSAAAHLGGVVVLTDGPKMAPATAAYLATQPKVPRYAVGGPAAAADPSATAVVGSNRFGTALAVAERFFPHATQAGLATGLTFPDALAAGARLGRLGAPLLLSGPSGLPTAVASYLAKAGPGLSSVELYGGDAALSPAVLAQVRKALGIGLG